MNALKKCRERLLAITAEIRAINDTAEKEERNALTEAEETTYTALRTERDAVEARIKMLVDEEARSAATAKATKNLGGTGPATISSEPRTYGPVTRSSYFLDLARVQLGRGDGDGGVSAARDRLDRHTKELEVELPAREARRDAADLEVNERELRSAGYNRRARGSAFETRVNPNRTDGQGGQFVPPIYLIDEYIDLPRFGRACANMCKNLPLPSGTDSINLPKIATGTAVATQLDAGAVNSQDLTDALVSAPVRTIAGQQDVAIQLLDQSPIAFDEVVMGDLLADYDSKLDIQVINGSGAAGQMKGILNVAGINSVVYTDATPTLQELWPSLLQSASKVATLRKLAATGVCLSPSMWYWALSQLDSTGRPLILSTPNGYNPMGDSGVVESEGPVGTFTYGLPGCIDGNIPANLGAGINESRVITARWQDLFLWEGQMRTRVLSEVLSNTLQVRIQIYNYAALMADRRPESISVISGTGTIPAAGF